MSAIIGREERFDPTLYNNGPAPIPEDKRNRNWVHYSTVRSQSVQNRATSKLRQAHESTAVCGSHGFVLLLTTASAPIHNSSRTER